MTVKDIMRDAVVIREDASFKDALTKMLHEQTNSLLVTNEAGTLVGELTVSDILAAVVPDYLEDDSIAAHFATEAMFEEAIHNAVDMPVHEFMKSAEGAINEDDTLMAAAVSVIQRDRARVPVVDVDSKPVGIISRRGIKQLIAKTLGIEETA